MVQKPRPGPVKKLLSAQWNEMLNDGHNMEKGEHEGTDKDSRHPNDE